MYYFIISNVQRWPVKKHTKFQTINLINATFIKWRVIFLTVSFTAVRRDTNSHCDIDYTHMHAHIYMYVLRNVRSTNKHGRPHRRAGGCAGSYQRRLRTHCCTRLPRRQFYKNGSPSLCNANVLLFGSNLDTRSTE